MATAKTDTEDTAAELGREIKELRADLAALVSTVSDYIGRQASHAGEAAKEGVSHMAEALKSTASEARRRGEVAASEIEDMIAARPLTSVLVALGIGYVIGKLRH
ncbi:MAG: YqjD family protein [Bauldia sp.]